MVDIEYTTCQLADKLGDKVIKKVLNGQVVRLTHCLRQLTIINGPS